MKTFLLVFLFALLACACANVQTQQIPTNKAQPTSTVEGEEIGYPKFTKSDKQYLGCWRSVEASEVVNYELKFFRITEEGIQTSKVQKMISYKEIDSNNHKDYFVLQTESKNKDLQPYLSVNIVSDDEMTIQEFATNEEITNGEGKITGI